MMRIFIKLKLALAALSFVSGILVAHMLPISYLTVVPDQTHVHVEYVVNPFDLRFFSEIDKNHNRALDPDEMKLFEKLGTRHLVNLIELRVGGKVIKADVAGVNPDIGSHHVIYRAHYPVDARNVHISIRADLWSVLRSGNIIMSSTSIKGAPNRGCWNQETRL